MSFFSHRSEADQREVEATVTISSRASSRRAPLTEDLFLEESQNSIKSHCKDASLGDLESLDSQSVQVTCAECMSLWAGIG